MKDQSSLTALLSSFGRAYHAANATHPVFADPIAKKLMTGQEYETIGRYILGGIDFFAPEKKGYFLSEAEALRYLVNTQIAPTPLARAKFCEDSLQTAIRTGTRQYVILGAGMDTFAFRNPDFMEKYSVYEVDHPLTQADKRERIRRAGLSVPERLHFVPVDFSVDSLYDKMISAGFDPNQKTFFSWLGVSYYLSEEQIGRMLESIAKLSAKGSTLLFDYGDEGLFSTKVKRVQNMRAMAAAGGEPMKTCFSYGQLERLLERYRFLIYELLSPDDIQNLYFEGRNDDLSAFEHICYVTAVSQS